MCDRRKRREGKKILLVRGECVRDNLTPKVSGHSGWRASCFPVEGLFSAGVERSPSSVRQVGECGGEKGAGRNVIPSYIRGN